MQAVTQYVSVNTPSLPWSLFYHIQRNTPCGSQGLFRDKPSISGPSLVKGNSDFPNQRTLATLVFQICLKQSLKEPYVIPGKQPDVFWGGHVPQENKSEIRHTVFSSWSFIIHIRILKVLRSPVLKDQNLNTLMQNSFSRLTWAQSTIFHRMLVNPPLIWPSASV